MVSLHGEKPKMEQSSYSKPSEALDRKKGKETFLFLFFPLLLTVSLLFISVERKWIATASELA